MPLRIILSALSPYISLLKKVAFVVVALVVVFSLFASFRKIDSKQNSITVQAKKQISESNRKQMYQRLAETQDAKYEEQEVTVRQLNRWALCFTVGELCTNNPNEASVYKNESLSMKLAGLVSMPLRNPPSSFIYLARETLENAGFVPKTYATGIGFYALSSFQPIWKAFRDLAYLVIVLVMVAVGFMIMFGIGGGGKTAVTLESALPKLVIALLTISFSYAIAGFFIDMMYVLIILIVSLLGPQTGMDAPSQGALASQLINGTPKDLFVMMLGQVGHSDNNFYDLASSFYNIIPNYMQFVLDAIANMTAGTLLGSWGTSTKFPKIDIKSVGTNPGAFFGSWGKILRGVVGKNEALMNVLEKAIGSGGGVWGVSTYALIINVVISLVVQVLLGPFITKSILTFIFILSMIVIVFRLFFALLFVYIDIILSVMFAPITLMFEAIPGQNAFSKWMKGLIANLMVFPIFTGIMLVVRIIMDNPSGTNMWTPPFVSVISDQTSLQTVVGAVILFSIPQILKTFRKKMGAQSIIGDLNLGIGALFVGAAPIISGGSLIVKNSGIGKAFADRITGPLKSTAPAIAGKAAEAVQSTAGPSG